MPARFYISPAQEGRAALARWWRTIPPALSAPGVTSYDLGVMAEFRERVIAAEEEFARKKKYGLPLDDDTRRHKGRGPRPGDTIVTGGKSGPEW